MSSQPPVTGPEATPEAIEARRTSFGATASAYDAVRPPWPATTVTWLLGSPNDGVSLDVLDVGAGTGLGTRTVASLGHRVLALDPSEKMVEVLEASKHTLPAAVGRRVTARVGHAEQVPVPDGSLDAVICLQAWHWFDHDQAAAECARLVRSGGWVGLAWHTWDSSAPWVSELAEIVGRPEMTSLETDEVAFLSDDFSPVENAVFELNHELTVDELVLLATSWSFVAVRDDQDEVLSAVRALGDRVAKASGGRLVFPLVSGCYRFRRLASART